METFVSLGWVRLPSTSTPCLKFWGHQIDRFVSHSLSVSALQQRSQFRGVLQECQLAQNWDGPRQARVRVLPLDQDTTEVRVCHNSSAGEAYQFFKLHENRLIDVFYPFTVQLATASVCPLVQVNINMIPRARKNDRRTIICHSFVSSELGKFLLLVALDSDRGVIPGIRLNYDFLISNRTLDTSRQSRETWTFFCHNHNMPGFKLYGRLLQVGTDDMVLPGFCGLILRLVW